LASKWADYLISKVRYDSDETEIIKVKSHEDKGDKVGSSFEETRDEVVENLNEGTSYCTIFKNDEGKWEKGEDVHPVTVEGETYIRTDRNQTAEDNLGNLPTF
jgi:hypothetical protein